MIKLKKKVKDILRIALPIALVAILSVTAIFLYFSLNADEKNPYNVSNGSLEFTMDNTPEVSIFSATETHASEDPTVKSLTAEVITETALPQHFTWFTYWETSGNETNDAGDVVATYLTLTVREDADNTVDVKCLKPFADKGIIVIKAQVESGSFATCKVTFEGIPTEIKLNKDVSKIPVFYQGKAEDFQILIKNPWVDFNYKPYSDIPEKYFEVSDIKAEFADGEFTETQKKITVKKTKVENFHDFESEEVEMSIDELMDKFITWEYDTEYDTYYIRIYNLDNFGYGILNDGSIILDDSYVDLNDGYIYEVQENIREFICRFTITLANCDLQYKFNAYVSPQINVTLNNSEIIF